MKNKEKLNLREINVKSFTTSIESVVAIKGGHKSGCPGCPTDALYTQLAPWCSGIPQCPA